MTATADRQLTLADLLPAGIVTRREDIPLELLPILPGPPPDAAFRESIARFGVLEPIIVGAPGPLMEALAMPNLTLLDGRRRLAAARLAGHATIPSIIVQSDAPDAVFTLTLNEQRSPNPVAELDAIQDLLRSGASEAVIAAATGMGLQTVRKRLKLTRLVLGLRVPFYEGRLAPSVAEAASGLTPAQQERLVAVLEETGKLTAADVRAARTAQAQAAVAALPADMFAALDLTAPPAPAGIDPETVREALYWASFAGGESKTRLEDRLRRVHGILSAALAEPRPSPQNVLDGSRADA